MLGQLSWKEKSDSGLDLSGGDGGPLVVVSQSGSLCSDSLEDIVDEAVHDAHGLAGDTSVGVHLFQDFVDVDGVGFPPPPLSLLVPSTLGLCLGGGLLGSFAAYFGWHVDALRAKRKVMSSQ